MTLSGTNRDHAFTYILTFKGSYIEKKNKNQTHRLIKE